MGGDVRPGAIAAEIGATSIADIARRFVTPSYGLRPVIACSVAGMRLGDALTETGIMLLPMLAVLALVILLPSIAPFVPGMISPEFRP